MASAPPSARDLLVRSGTRQLDGTLVEPDPARATGAGVVFVQGMGSSRSGYRGRALAVSSAVGCHCITVNRTGPDGGARSTGSGSVGQHLDDLAAVHDLLVREGVDRGRLGACGASYGALLVALLTGLRPLAGLLLRAPALLADVVPPEPPPDPAHDGLAALRRYAGPVTVVESERDEVIPHSVVEAHLAACARPTHRTIPDARHALTEPEWDRTFVRYVVDWAAVL